MNLEKYYIIRNIDQIRIAGPYFSYVRMKSDLLCLNTDNNGEYSSETVPVDSNESD